MQQPPGARSSNRAVLVTSLLLLLATFASARASCQTHLGHQHRPADVRPAATDDTLRSGPQLEAEGCDVIMTSLGPRQRGNADTFVVLVPGKPAQSGRSRRRYSFGLGKRPSPETEHQLPDSSKGWRDFALSKGRQRFHGSGSNRIPADSPRLEKRQRQQPAQQRQPYGFGLGKRLWNAWFDGPTRDLLKRPSYGFGLGKRSASDKERHATGSAAITDSI